VRKLVLLSLLLAVLIPSAEAIQIPLSKYVSDGLNPPDVEFLDAIFDFTIVDSTTLQLAITNLTPDEGGPSFKINEIYFNAKQNVTGLTLTNVINSPIAEWDMGFSQGGGGGGSNPHQVNGFGKFDVYLKDGHGLPADVVEPGETVTFTMSIAGTEPFSDLDFIELSTQVDGHTICTAAAKFYNGDEMSAYGATDVPEPTTLCLFGLGSLLMLSRKRRV